MWLFLAFLAVPLIEIALFIQIGGAIGLWPTLAIVIATAVLGTSLVRSQGALAMNDLRSSFSNLNDPTEALANGAMILLAGVMLLTPGFFTDAVGFALLTPPVRLAVFRWARSRIKVQQFSMGPDPRAGHPHPGHPRSGHAGNVHPGAQGSGPVIDGEFEEIDPKPGNPNAPSGWTKH